MELGLVYFPTDRTVPPPELARIAEGEGFGSLFVTEHTHIPVDHSPYPAGGELPDEYKRIHDPFVGLAMAAAVTERLVIGTGICLVAQHDPLVLAKTVASLQTLSGGRLVLGIGAGWNEPEMANHRVDPSSRFAQMREHVLALRTLWDDETSEFHGDFVDFDPLWSLPKPSHPVPVVIGGWGPTVEERVAEYGDGWFPFGMGNPDKLAARIATCREKAAAAGRSDPLTIVVYGARREAEALARYEEMGVDHALFALREAATPQDNLDEVRELTALL